MQSSLHIALYQPSIPANTGAIGRLCLLSCAHLHLIEPLGFSLDDKSLLRSGLDYWSNLNYSLHNNLASFLRSFSGSSLYYLSSHAEQCYSKAHFPFGSVFLFGSEVDGLPLGSCLLENLQGLRIPMLGGQRCHNLATSVAIVAYEMLRQNNFPNLC